MRFGRLILPALLCAGSAFAQPTMSGITTPYGGMGGNSPGMWTISGTGFSTTPKATRFVDVNNADLFAAVSCSSATSCDAFSLRANRVPNGTAQNVAVFALVNNVKSLSSVNFLYYAPPTITSLSPSTGPISSNTIGTVNGGPFTRNAAGFPGMTSVYLYTFIQDYASGCGSTSGCAFTAPRIDTDLSAQQGAYYMNVITPGGSANTYFLYGTTPSTPTITSVSPSSGPASGGNVVTITGTNLRPVATATRTFTFITPTSSDIATSVTCSSNTTCTATVPAGGQGGKANVQAVVTCPSGTACAGTRSSNSIPGVGISVYRYAGLSVTPGQAMTLLTSENGQAAQFTVALHSQPSANVHIAVSTTGGRATISNSGLDFTASNWETPQPITVTGINDTGVGGAASPGSGNTSYTVDLASSSTDAKYNNLFANQYLTNLDNDTKNIFIAPTAGLVTHRGGGTATFTVVLTAAPSSTVTINFYSTDPLAGTVSPASLTFATSSGGGTGWDVPRTVTVTGVNDGAPGRDMPYAIVSSVVAGDATYAGLYTTDVQVTNVDAPPNPPANVLATATSGTSVNVTWSSNGGTTYEIFRTGGGLGSVSLGSTAGSPFIDSTAVANTAYLYSVRSTVPLSNVSAPDLATTTIFTDPVLTIGTSTVRAVHVSELRTATNAVRVLSGQVAYSFTDPTLNSSIMVKALHINEARSVLNTARSALGLSAVTYTRPTLTAGSSLISAVDVTDLRNGVK
jgi:hypothetical protein